MKFSSSRRYLSCLAVVGYLALFAGTPFATATGPEGRPERETEDARDERNDREQREAQEQRDDVDRWWAQNIAFEKTNVTDAERAEFGPDATLVTIAGDTFQVTEGDVLTHADGTPVVDPTRPGEPIRIDPSTGKRYYIDASGEMYSLTPRLTRDKGKGKAIAGAGFRRVPSESILADESSPSSGAEDAIEALRNLRLSLDLGDGDGDADESSPPRSLEDPVKALENLRLSLNLSNNDGGGDASAPPFGGPPADWRPPPWARDSFWPAVPGTARPGYTAEDAPLAPGEARAYVAQDGSLAPGDGRGYVAEDGQIDVPLVSRSEYGKVGVGSLRASAEAGIPPWGGVGPDPAGSGPPTSGNYGDIPKFKDEVWQPGNAPGGERREGPRIGGQRGASSAGGAQPLDPTEPGALADTMWGQETTGLPHSAWGQVTTTLPTAWGVLTIPPNFSPPSGPLDPTGAARSLQRQD